MIVDPAAQVIRYASPRAIALVGPVLNRHDLPVSEVFLTEGTGFASFMRDALTVTSPIIS